MRSLRALGQFILLVTLMYPLSTEVFGADLGPKAWESLAQDSLAQGRELLRSAGINVKSLKIISTNNRDGILIARVELCIEGAKNPIILDMVMEFGGKPVPSPIFAQRLVNQYQLHCERAAYLRLVLPSGLNHKEVIGELKLNLEIALKNLEAIERARSRPGSYLKLLIAEHTFYLNQGLKDLLPKIEKIAPLDPLVKQALGPLILEAGLVDRDALNTLSKTLAKPILPRPDKAAFGFDRSILERAQELLSERAKLLLKIQEGLSSRELRALEQKMLEEHILEVKRILRVIEIVSTQERSVFNEKKFPEFRTYLSLLSQGTLYLNKQGIKCPLSARIVGHGAEIAMLQDDLKKLAEDIRREGDQEKTKLSESEEALRRERIAGISLRFTSVAQSIQFTEAQLLHEKALLEAKDLPKEIKENLIRAITLDLDHVRRQHMEVMEVHFVYKFNLRPR